MLPRLNAVLDPEPRSTRMCETRPRTRKHETGLGLNCLTCGKRSIHASCMSHALKITVGWLKVVGFTIGGGFAPTANASPDIDVSGDPPANVLAHFEAPEDRADISAIAPREDGGATVFVTEESMLTIMPASGERPSGPDLETLAASISCTLNVQNVHGSTYESGTINGVARIECTRAAGRLQIHYSLIRITPSKQWAGLSRENSGWTFIQTNRAVDCSEGGANFRGWAQGIIAPPLGYTLVGPAIANAYGNITTVRCGTNGPVAEPAGATLTVTFLRDDLATSNAAPPSRITKLE